MKELHYHQCLSCHRLMCRSTRVPDSQRCDLCRSRMDYAYSVPVQTPEQEHLHARGRVYNPHPERVIRWVCVRCEKETPYFDAVPRLRADGKCCNECVKAEAVPPLLTLDEQRARQERKAASRREMEDSQERSYQKAEQQEIR